MIHQMRYLSPDDIEMLRQGNEIIQKKYLKVNSTKHRTKRFGLATWLLGWAVYRNARNLMSIKRNIQNLYDQNVLQEKQIIELTHYLNVTYGHVHTNRLVINELNIQVATLNKTMMAVIGETKFINFTVAALTDMRIDSCTAILRINEFTRKMLMPFMSCTNYVVLIILMASLLPMLASIGFIVWQVYKVRSRIKGFKPMAKLLLGDDLQNPKLNEETARQILALIRNPITTVTHNLTQPSTSNTQQRIGEKRCLHLW